MKAKLLIFSLICSSLTANAQCYPDRHNTSWNEGWVSCETALSPNPERGLGYWIQYDFGHTYTLGQMHLWNYNAPAWLQLGISELAVDYSMDGTTWKTLGTYGVGQADGTSTYEGEDVAHFSGDTARYVLLTGLGNFGGNCLALSEVKFEILENVSEIFTFHTNDCFKVALYPNPHTDQFSFGLTTQCPGPAQYFIYDHTGKLILKGHSGGHDGTMQRIVNTNGMAAGLYHLVVQQGGKVERYPIVKMRP